MLALKVFKWILHEFSVHRNNFFFHSRLS